jgi:hypothetical protein
MKDKEIDRAVNQIIQEYIQVLKSAARRTFIIPESELPHNKKAIKNAIRIALSSLENQDEMEQLKSAYISLANFVSKEEAGDVEAIPEELFSFLEMGEDKKRDFLRDRFKSGLLGDYERALKITRKIAEEQKQLRKDIEEFGGGK